MKRFAEFLKTTLMGGLIVLLPLLLLYLLLAEALPLVIALAAPIAALFPQGTVDQIKMPGLMALILIVGVSFMMGLALRHAAGRRLGKRIEQRLLGGLPTYSTLKNLTKGFVGAQLSEAIRPALVISPLGERELAYIIEKHEDGQLTVLVPLSPMPFTGSLKIVDQDRVKILDVNLRDFTRVLSEWGVGARDLMRKGGSDTKPPPTS